MTAIELLETYPKAAKVINEFYHKKMVDSLDTQDVPDEFKEMLRQQEFDNQYIANFIDANPRILFDVFDANNIIIHTPSVWIEGVVEFGYTVERKNIDTLGSFETHPQRTTAEKIAVEKAFEYLNNQL